MIPGLLLLLLVGVALSSRGSSATAAPSGEFLEWGYRDGKPFQLVLTSVGTDSAGRAALLRPDAAAAYVAMRDEAAKLGLTFVINRAFATFAQQQALRALYESGKGALAAPPGYSNHQQGIAVDVETVGPSADVFDWLTFNAARFNWKRTVPSEPWHWEFYL
jgi:LAS superfamily LD-carboxypeptidase LdcB